MGGDKQVVSDAEILEKFQGLEGANQTQLGALVGLEYGKVVAVEVRCPRRGWNVARDGIDERGLAGPVRADQADERSGFDDEIHAVVGVEATEGDGQAFGLEKGGHVISLPTMSGWVTCPRRSVV